MCYGIGVSRLSVPAFSQYLAFCVTMALPSGVGFLGGALIWKGAVFVKAPEMHQVHGLMTAASLW